MFSLDSRLAADTVNVGELALCQIRLMNDRQFPWLILVPQRPDVTEITALSDADQSLLWQESAQVSRVMQSLFRPDKMNIAALGNVVAQLHIHHIARYKNDAAWPHPVWGRQPAVAYHSDALDDLIQSLRQQLTLSSA